MTSSEDRVAGVKALLPGDLGTRFTEEDIVSGLHVRKGSIEEAARLLHRHAHARLEYPDLFAKMSPESVVKTVDHFKLAPVRGIKTRDGLSVAYMDSGSWDPETISWDSAFAAVSLIWDIHGLLSRDFLDPGFVLINDMANLGIKQVKALPIKACARNYHLLYENMICRPIMSIHINYSLLEDMTFKAAKPFLPKAMKESVHHFKKEQLSQLLGPEVVESKRYLPTKQDIEEHHRLLQQGMPLALARHERVMLSQAVPFK